MSFADYVQSLGATQRPILMDATPLSVNGFGSNFLHARPDYSFGQRVPTLTDNDNHDFKNRGYNNPYEGNRAAFVPGYVDQSGGFLGYGQSLDSLRNSPGVAIGYAEYMANQPGLLASAEAQRIANEQAALELQQQRAAQRSQSLPSIGQNVDFMGLLSPQQPAQQQGGGQQPAQQQGGGMTPSFLNRGSYGGLIGGGE